MKQPRIVDLTYPVTSEMLVYPGTERPTFQWVGRVNSEGFNMTRMTMLVHTGTHIDSPNHFLDGIQWIDEVSLDHFYGPAKLFRLPQQPEGQQVTLKDVLATGFDLNEGDIFVFATGVERYADTRDYNYKYPVPSPDLIDWLISKKVKAFMTDATSVDPFSAKESVNHKQLFVARIPIVENLCHLAELPANKHFIINALPLKLVGREGSPCRAIALLDED